MSKPEYLSKTHRYRTDIDMLRAIAVASVVLFHAGFAELSGGFVGVDIFFVISGYLISKHLLEEADRTGKVSIAVFYQKRLRRIGPALLTVLFATTCGALILLFPPQLEDYFASLLAALSFVSNIYFWSQSGYFAAQENTIPLLHTWSLAVEEQFYIFIPLLVLLFATRKRVLRLTVLTGFVISLSLSVWQSDLRPGASFYLLPTRMWELLLGTIVAQLVIDRSPALNWLSPRMSATAGLGLIGVSLFAIDEQMAFPSWIALLPCVGTALVIIAGRDEVPSSVTYLTSRPVLHLGLISYSLYLWHWPVIVFWRYLIPHSDGLLSKVAVIGISYLLAVVSWKFIESPTRKPGFSFRSLGVGAAFATIAIATVSAVGISKAGFPERFSSEVVRYAAASQDRAPVPETCALSEEVCQFGADEEVRFVLIGDSYAGALFPAFDEIFKDQELSGALLHQNSCPPLYDYRPTTGSVIDADKCHARNTSALDTVARNGAIQEVFLAAMSFENDDQLIGLAKTIELFRKNAIAVSVLYGLPKADDDLPLALAKAEAFGHQPPALVPRQENIANFALQYQGDTGVRFIDLSAVFCTGGTCRPEIDGHPIYHDTGHLTETVSRTAVADYLSSVVS